VRDVPLRIRLSPSDGNPHIALWDLTVEVKLCAVTASVLVHQHCSVVWRAERRGHGQ
jgi:hypothetical protein